jgi:hypothetical protein
MSRHDGGLNNERPKGKCQHCGKLNFVTRKGARIYGKAQHPGQKLSAYPCYSNTDMFHYGHTPPSVIRGEVSRHHLAIPKRKDDGI